MENDIKTGDLVMVVRGAACCGASETLGKIFRVEGIAPFDGRCSGCGRKGNPDVKLALRGPGIGYPFYRLIKIDPPAQPESTETRKEITA